MIVDWAATLPIASRAAHFTAVLAAFGTLVCRVAIVPLVCARDAGTPTTRLLAHRLANMTLFWLGLALLGGMVWLAAETVAMSGAIALRDAAASLPVVLLHTHFGHALLVRCALLALAMPLAGRRADRGRAALGAAIVLVGAAVAVQAFIGHAAAIGGTQGAGLIAAESLHVLAAGAWLGGLPALLLLLSGLEPAQGAAAADAFFPVGLASVLLLGGTGVFQGTALVGGLPGLFGTSYGIAALVKIGLFALLAGLAALNRFAFAPGMTGDAARPRRLIASIVLETALGLAVVTAAASIASLPPGVHATPVWPFAVRPNLAALADPALRQSAWLGMAGIGTALLAGIVGALWRRARWPILAVAVAALMVAMPRLNVLLVPAYPTSFMASPTEFADSAIAHGAALFRAQCAACHGPTAEGDGPFARRLPMPPADLTAAHLWAHSSGDLFWYITRGWRMPDGTSAMPGFAGVLSSEAAWDLVDFLHAHNAGEGLRRSGAWPHPVPVPQFGALCAGGRGIDLDDLRGRMLRFVALAGPEQPLPPLPPELDMTTIVLARDRATPPDRQTCVAGEPETWTAFAVLAGVAEDQLGGTEFVADRNSWLRLVRRAEPGGAWTETRALHDTLRAIALQPLPIDAGGSLAHRH